VDPIERFSDAAKTALVLAQEEAERAHHSYIGTEHLLLGVVREGKGRAAVVLRSLGVEIKAVRSAMEEILGRNERITIRQIVPTARVKKVIELSFEEARSAGHEEVGTEHLLLGLLIEGEGVAAHILQHLGAGLDTVRDRLSRGVPSGEPVRTARAVPDARDEAGARAIDEIVRRAFALPRQRGEVLGTEHLLLALAEQASGRASEILERHGLTRSAIEGILDDRASAPPPSQGQDPQPPG
jgi:ATP-dependent Clp protease ATP-binding subunit ClpA